MLYAKTLLVLNDHIKTELDKFLVNLKKYPKSTFTKYTD